MDGSRRVGNANHPPGQGSWGISCASESLPRRDRVHHELRRDATAIRAALSLRRTVGNVTKKMYAAAALVASILGFAGYLTFASGGRVDVTTSCLPEDTSCVRMLELAASTSSPTEAFAAFEGSLVADPSLRLFCHAASHHLGAAIWDRFGETAFTRGGGACAFGVYHGMLLRIAQTIPEQLGPRSERLCSMLARENVLQGEECIHGIGHALALVVDDINDAYAGCAALDMVVNGKGAFRQDANQKCNKGVTMEWTKRFEKEIPFPTEICTESILPSAYADCVDVAYSEELIRHVDRAAGANCSQFHPSVQTSCLNGIGGALARHAATSGDPMRFLNHPLCSSDETCLRAMMVGYVIDRGTDDAAADICNRLERSDVCLEAIAIARDLNRSLKD